MARSTRPFRTVRRSLPVPTSGTARLAIVSDTHGRPHPALGERLAALRPGVILHAGDVGERTVLDDLAAIAPVHAVRGNIDDRAPDLPDALVLTFEAPDGRALRVFLTHVGVFGPRLVSEARLHAGAADAGLVVCGHSHVPLLVRDGPLVVFNPGSCGPRRFQLPITFGVAELTGGGLRLHHVDCLTGERWRPPA